VLQAQFPSVTLVIDPVLQMQRELDLLRQRSGAVGSGDLESLLATLGQAATAEPWPGLSAIDHDASSTRLGVEAFGSAALGVWQARLQAAGLSVQTEDQSLVVRP
jgi:general secretion pathway protein L